MSSPQSSEKTRPHPVLGKRVCLGAQGFLCTSQLSSIRSFLTSKSYACHDDKQTYITMAWSHNATSTFTGTHFTWPKNTAGSCCQWVSMENPWTAMLTKRKWQNPWNFDVSLDAPSTSNDHYKAGFPLRGDYFRRSRIPWPNRKISIPAFLSTWPASTSEHPTKTWMGVDPKDMDPEVKLQNDYPPGNLHIPPWQTANRLQKYPLVGDMGQFPQEWYFQVSFISFA